MESDSGKLGVTPFIADEDYYCSMYIKPDYGYQFTNDTTFILNGKTYSSSTNFGVISTGLYHAYCSFDTVAPVIDYAEFYDLKEPVAGESMTDPSYLTALVSDYADYTVESISWSNIYGSGSTFEAGKTYDCLFRLKGKGAYVFESYPDLTLVVNGRQIDADDTYYWNDGQLCEGVIYFTVPYANTGVTVSGTVTSFGSETDSTYIQLILSGTTEAAYETTIAGTGAKAYSIPNVTAGTYTVRVIKQNHVTRDYTITISSSNVTQDVKIHPLGDISGDGKITTIDFVRANSHARGVTLLAGYDWK